MPQDTTKAIPMVTFNSAALVAGYASMNPAGLPGACYWLQIFNNSSVDITISYDGVTDHAYIPQGYMFPAFPMIGAMPNNRISLFPAHMQIYAKGAAGVGNIYITGFYV